MRRERVQRKVPRKPRRPIETLPLDPRDGEIVRAKQRLYADHPRPKAA
jgi:hypothetical protein